MCPALRFRWIARWKVTVDIVPKRNCQPSKEQHIQHKKRDGCDHLRRQRGMTDLRERERDRGARNNARYERNRNIRRHQLLPPFLGRSHFPIDARKVVMCRTHKERANIGRKFGIAVVNACDAETNDGIFDRSLQDPSPCENTQNPKRNQQYKNEDEKRAGEMGRTAEESERNKRR